MAYDKKAKSFAPTIIKKYASKKKSSRQPVSPYKNSTPEYKSAKQALNSMNENYPYFTPKNKRKILKELVNAIKRIR
jgi:hypothetical protein